MIAAFLARAAGQVPPESTQQALGYPSLFILVVLGSLVPVVPTGALVSTAAVVAFHQTAWFSLLLVFAVGALAAFLGTSACTGWGSAGCARAVGRGGWRRCGSGPRRTAWSRPRRS
ncbi:hypothetical protein BX283_6445 [Streptomyces sp. TLI_146]|nr:hypothetical protein BX283_6445 [Streptomyces sp. TLI_146]